MFGHHRWRLAWASLNLRRRCTTRMTVLQRFRDSGRRWGITRGGGGSSRRKIGRESGAHARRAFDHQRAMMAVDDVFHDGEAESGARDFASLLAGNAVESLGEPGQMLARDTSAAIGNADSHISGLMTAFRRKQGKMPPAGIAQARP